MNTPKQLLHKDPVRLDVVGQYVANPALEQILHLAFSEYAFGLSSQTQPAVNDLKRQGAKELITIILNLGSAAEPPKSRTQQLLAPLPGDPGCEDYLKRLPTTKP